MVLLNNEYVQISLDTTVPCLEWIGKRFMPSESFRESEEKSLEFYRQFRDDYQGLQWYVDARNIGPVSTEDTQWVADEILPQFAQLGLKKEGFVVPKSAIGKLTVKNYISKAGETIEIKVFDTVEGVKNWLKE